jgi:hypothetical protein
LIIINKLKLSITQACNAIGYINGPAFVGAGCAFNNSNQRKQS